MKLAARVNPWLSSKFALATKGVLLKAKLHLKLVATVTTTHIAPHSPAILSVRLRGSKDVL